MASERFPIGPTTASQPDPATTISQSSPGQPSRCQDIVPPKESPRPSQAIVPPKESPRPSQAIVPSISLEERKRRRELALALVATPPAKLRRASVGSVVADMLGERKSEQVAHKKAEKIASKIAASTAGAQTPDKGSAVSKANGKSSLPRTSSVVEAQAGDQPPPKKATITHEGSRSQYLARTGRKGKGESHKFVYDKESEKAAARKAAQAWLFETIGVRVE